MPFEPEQNQPYSLSFTAASLRPELARIIAEAFLACGDWGQARQRVLTENTLQARTPASAIRMEREIRQRIETLSRRQIEILAEAPADSRRAIAWLSILKYSAFVFVFSFQDLRGKIESLDPVLRPSDYENFFIAQAETHPELGNLATSTKEKIRRVMITMLREAGILGEGRKDFTLQRPVVPPDVLSAILADNRRWLAGFLVPDDEIAALRE
ncbi:MAG: hypothetical protein A3F84_09095 [Candidatus Handelsmanbacteria bacterium RIFCSPLOWO2_12_FULL_64_10]|uniref:Inner membrane protein n=1 Tax=Handelsmanbacteria sp. (strain RIFCSPLOWO2_12_FULL_64_10) TaxID=1817868 RepID=A0A1F6CTP0_HANXR|nr:MAG: hypothetical protein A3F84_09095 [Candidatus Handelsmanbacteria bacterium RIFCSPLOWO2_12_FULL_64_10]